LAYTMGSTANRSLSAYSLLPDLLQTELCNHNGRLHFQLSYIIPCESLLMRLLWYICVCSRFSSPILVLWTSRQPNLARRFMYVWALRFVSKILSTTWGLTHYATIRRRTIFSVPPAIDPGFAEVILQILPPQLQSIHERDDVHDIVQSLVH